MNHILIADDERTIREGIQRTIELVYPKAVVYVAASTAEAVEIMGQHHMDVVLTDILMPGMNGLEFMRISKRRFPHVKWVVISAHSEFSYAQEAVRLGARDYLLKPIGKKRLIEVMEGLDAEIKKDAETSRGGELLKANLKYLHEGIFRRLASGLDTGSLDILSFTQDYSTFHLVMVALEAGDKPVQLEHFIVENVLLELIERHGKGLGISLDPNTLLGIARLRQDTDLEAFQGELKGHLKHYIKIPFHIVVSGLNHEFNCVPEVVSQMRSATAAQQIKPLKGSGEKAIEVALEYIQTHYHEDLSLEKVAAVVFLNSAYFSQLFKLKMGQGYKEYVISLRLAQAKQLLLNPKLRLVDISERVGYQDMKHFTQVFRKKFGLTPTEFRQQQNVNVI
ncbi:two-component system response regulator YesN [Paenibacillus shirakamiensis]|uniref:Two-component system response regulator YesN n=1 Tax=Paenibacillus shirakamiensis TaxID=1265935 RepID=A0ABS4JKL6_9BACL|nr:response regulator [Paenibacillus shirakamiensis]MBP2001521.1 two-component system response regulator YesN [Paenibacillus shirakamiensis]